MLARVPEYNLRLFRGVLVFAWLMLIASLFWDPYTPPLTDPDNLSSPFRLSNEPVIVQGDVLQEQPYAMGAAIFWGMVVPILPLFLMVFGHETWRRICPLSHLNQIPRLWSVQRHFKRFNRRNGQVELILANSGKQLNCSSADYILDIVSAAGIEVPSSCRAGQCGTCKIMMREGSVEHDSDDALNEGDREEGYILSCQAHVKGTVVLEL